ncbi:MAG: hypothetical protein VB065_10860 [Eubacteriales bacterium]|nr:hypothetical protein [Christensenellaceae bacterium]MEA5066540.1 hypothetical protein [Eubacteriales bacterium]
MNNLVRKLFAVALMAVLCSGLLFVENPAVHNFGTSPAKAEEVVLRAPTLVWRYKYIDGKLHKRLFNESTQQWVGEWIPV